MLNNIKFFIRTEILSRVNLHYNLRNLSGICMVSPVSGEESD
jgi:hypothetical protein